MRRNRKKKIANRSDNLSYKEVLSRAGHFFPYLIWLASFLVVVFWAIAIMCIVFEKVPVL